MQHVIERYTRVGVEQAKFVYMKATRGEYLRKAPKSRSRAHIECIDGGAWLCLSLTLSNCHLVLIDSSGDCWRDGQHRVWKLGAIRTFCCSSVILLAYLGPLFCTVFIPYSITRKFIFIKLITARLYNSGLLFGIIFSSSCSLSNTCCTFLRFP